LIAEERESPVEKREKQGEFEHPPPGVCSSRRR
jgi:hypothetical protein